jgi:hypothetical protein
MTPEPMRRVYLAICVLALLSGSACSEDSGTDPGGTTTLLDVSVDLPNGENCSVGGVAREFTTILGREVTVTATGPANRNVQITVYDTDYTTQLGSAESSQGTARVTATAQVGGTHYVVACERDGMAASVRIVVKQAVF